MQILITGATGLVGSEIVRLCHEQNIGVNYLTTNKNKLISKGNYKGFYWNPDVGEIDLNCFKGVSAIINLAGASISKRWTPKYKKVVLSSRINTLRTLQKGLEQIDDSNISSFVSASAIGIYPNSLSNFYTEDEESVDDSFLGEVVEAWEREIDAFEKFDFKVSKLRVGLVMSADGGALPEMAKPIRYYAGAAFGSGMQWQSWIHITDLARQFLFLIEHQLQGVYNGVGPNPVNNAKLVKEIAKVLDKPLFLPNVPQFAMKAILGEMSYLLFASQRVSSKKIEEEGFVFHFPNVCRAIENIYLQETQENNFEGAQKKEYV
ncbi:TIGR01777 family protein [Maribacter algarum]|uniref:TIGR01777 family protein n=1 Tax=Maribacter algarum (ex Zhang et al. 2020) TaxID=2578118 RepID=A0A5S3PGD7_9FLAO|nr:TIGR01777 family oxidoreductase [Maribacter algarum]TMM53193.1 TIGR01777 family protein [Maribacter algarum]